MALKIYFLIHEFYETFTIKFPFPSPWALKLEVMPLEPARESGGAL